MPAVRRQIVDRPGRHRTYLEAEEKGRLIQSLKSFLASRSLRSTEVFGRQVALEDLIANILRDLRVEAQRQFPGEINASGGGPSGSDLSAQRATTMTRMRRRDSRMRCGAQALTGFLSNWSRSERRSITNRRLDRDELILIGDFGGGTSDFSLLRVGPSIRERDVVRKTCWGTKDWAWPAMRSMRRLCAILFHPRSATAQC